MKTGSDRADSSAGATATLLVILGLACWSLWAELQSPVAADSDAALAEAIEQVRAGFAPGDVVMVTPEWDERPWAPLHGVGVGAQDWPFEALAGRGPVDAADLLTFERAWVIGTFGRAPVLPLAAVDGPAEWSEDFGDGVSVVRYRIVAARPVARLTDGLKDARVRRIPADAHTPRTCHWKDGRHDCDLEHWLDVKVDRRDVGHRERSWVYAHPGPGSDRLSIQWGQIPAGGSALVRFGFTQASTRHDEGSVTRVRLLLGDELVETVELEPTDYGIERRLLTAQTRSSLTIEVEADDPSWREVMLQIDIMESVPPSLHQGSGRSAGGIPAAPAPPRG